ncbi:MAG: ATP-binding protein [Desulfitobacterium sp.]
MQISRGKIQSAQKVVIYGPEGIGKSTLASMFPDPVFIDTEGSTKHMDVARTPKPSSWTMILEQVKYFRNNPSECGTLVLDTADWAEQLCTVEVCSKAQKDSISKFAHGQGYVILAEEYGRLLNLLEELVERGVNAVITAHATMRKFEQPDEMGGYDRWELKLQKKTAPLVKEWADMVLFANYKTYAVKGEDERKKKAQGGKRVMYTSHHPCWDAKNRHDLAEELPFEYAAIAHCIPDKPGLQQQRPKQEVAFLGDEKPKAAEVKIPEPPKHEPPTQQPVKSEPEQKEPYNEDLTGLPKALADLMLTNEVTIEEIQQAVASKGYYPQNTPIDKYDPDFVAGVLVGAWVQVFKMITDFRDDIPF